MVAAPPLPLPQLNTSSRKRAYALLEDSAPLRRSCRTRVETRKAREALEDLAQLNPLKRRGAALGYAFLPNRRGWEIEDLENVRLAKDGSI